eukprot:7201088-Prymnesium_polylepis.1
MGLKLLANEVLGAAGVAETVSANDGADDGAEGCAEVRSRGHALIKLQLRMLEREGALGAAADGNDDERAQLRLAAACGLFKLGRVPLLRADAAMGPLGWHRLALTLQD